MDLSMLLSQAQLSYTKQNFYKSSSSKTQKKKNNQDAFIQIFEQNSDLIQSFLPQNQIRNLRLICRGIGYLFIVRDLWTGMKIQVADKKLQDMDDYDFVEEEPKQISKEDKKIKIHSLKKNMAFSISKKQPVKQRQASNIKQKNISMAIIDNQFNPMRKTQIGFKRLLKTTNPKLSNLSNKNIVEKSNALNEVDQSLPIQRLSQLLQIPSNYTIDDLLINQKDTWVKNMHRANNLITVVKKWNMFSQRLWNFLQRQQSDLLPLMKKIIKTDGCLLNYKTTFQQEPHHTILNIISESAPKNALIQDQLNKLGKQFLQNHNKLSSLIQKRQCEQLITQIHQSYQKLTQISKKTLDPSTWAQGISVIEQGYNCITSTLNSSNQKKLKESLSKSINNVYSRLTEQHIEKEIAFPIEEEKNIKVSLKNITLRFIIENSEFCQLVFQIIYNMYGKLSVSSSNSLNSSSLAQTKPMTKVLGSVTSIKQNQNVFSKKLKLMQKSSHPQPTSISNRPSNLSSTFQSSKFPSQLTKPQSFRSLKTLFGILWNISKYFDKLQKQLSLKQKKKKQQQKIKLIKSFMENEYLNYKEDIVLVFYEKEEEKYQRSLLRLDEYYKEFKKKIENLKEEMNGKEGNN